jgi:hypothetical protein
MKVWQIVSEIVFFLVMLFNIVFWVCNGCRLPKYVHWLAAIAFLFGGVACYEVVLLGNGIVGTWWVPFLFAGIVYVVFIFHGVGLPSEKEMKQATEKWKKATEAAEEDETEGEEQQDD